MVGFRGRMHLGMKLLDRFWFGSKMSTRLQDVFSLKKDFEIFRKTLSSCSTENS